MLSVVRQNKLTFFFSLFLLLLGGIMYIRAAEYKPLLDEIERIQAEAGIEASDVQRRTGPSVAGGGGPAQDSRHRR
jgi:hypothetical protein